MPTRIATLDALPLTPSGKADRRAILARLDAAPAAPSAAPAEDAGLRGAGSGRLVRALRAMWADVLARPIEAIDPSTSFFDLGGHSLRLVEVQRQIEAALGVAVPLVDLFERPTVSALAAHLAAQLETTPDAGARPIAAPAVHAAAIATEDASTRSIAIVGLACRMPGADDAAAFWHLLRDGVEAIRHHDRATLVAAGVSEALLDDPHYVRADAVLDQPDGFDAAYFGMSPREAQITNPQQRVFLEVAVDAFEDAGIDPDRFDGRIGVYGGSNENLYLARILRAPALLAAVGAYAATVGNRADYLATRVAYKLGLTGPAMSVQTACSTSLVAIHAAVQALRQGECAVALAGGASIGDRRPRGYLHQPGGILSPDGRVRAFDADGAGMLPGHGVGLVVLKRLDDALRDGDAIRAVIRGTAINNDGRDKIGFTAPSVAGQAAVIAAAQADGGVAASTVSYVEAHGTATQLGDPIELTALNRAFRDGGARAQGTVGIGSVKTNIGHLDAAAGVAGVIKTALALEHELIPPSLHYCAPNPSLPLDDSPFRVVDAATPWPRTPAEADGVAAGADPLASVPRRAGVSSFGIGGTNAHAVLDAAPSAAIADDAPSYGLGGAHWLPLSGHTPAALARRAADLADWFDAEDRSADALAQVAR
ncbi:MAG: beta-ketoacyl synthase N-terminal-like domain-containing protein, partial [Acidobacteriota bacterium]